MSSTPNPIAIVITDGIDAAVVTKIQAIGVAAKESSASIIDLQSAITALSGSGITQLKSQIDSTSGSLTSLKSGLNGAATEQKNLSSATNDLTTAQNINASASQKIAAIMLQQVDASNALATAKKNLATSEKSLGQAAAAGSSSAQGIIQGYRDQYTAAAVLVNNLKQAKSAASDFKQSQDEVAPAVGKVVSANQAAAGAIRVLEGNFGTSVRAAENFLTTTLKLGPVLQAAFPIIGAIAFIGILDTIITHIDKAITHFKNLQVDSIAAELQALQNEQVIVKGDRGFGASVSNFFDSRPKLQDTTIADPSIALQRITDQLRLKTAIDQVNEAGKQGLALQQAKEAVVTNEIANTQTAIAQAQKLRDTIQQQLTATVKTTIPERPGIGNENTFGTQLKFPKDSPQSNQLLQQAQTVDASIRNLNQDLLLLKDAKLPTLEAGEGLKSLQDQARAARVQIKAFGDDIADLKTRLNESGTGASSDAGLQKQLSLLTYEMSQALPQNIEVLQARIATVSGEINRHAQVVGALFEKYNDAATSIGLYSDALKEANEFDKAVLQLKKDGITLTAQQTEQLKDLIKFTTENQQYQASLKQIYTEFQAPLKNYIAAFDAIETLERDGTITHAQALQAQQASLKTYNDSISPLTEYAHGLQNQIQLLGQYGTALTVATQVQSVNEQLRSKGLTLSSTEQQQLTKLLTLMEQQKEVQTDINGLYNANQGAVQKTVLQQQALIQAYQKGLISQEQFNVQLGQSAVAMANLNIQMGKLTKSDVLTSVFGGYLKDFKGFTVGVTQLWQQTFNTIADGAANSLGRAIAYGENLGDALKDVARQALSEIIAGMIKLGIQLLINTITAKAAQATATAASLAQAGALAAAWWDVASAVSLATFGANAAPAAAGMLGTSILGQGLALSGIGGKADGGLVTGPGTSTSDSILQRLSNKEFVMRASAVQSVGASTLEYMNRTGQVPNGGPKITILHDGSTGIQVVPYGEDEIRIMARQEANQVVQTKTPGVVAGHLDNPNSQLSKSLKRNTTTTRRR